MRYLLTLLLIAGLAFASIPNIFGPAGIPDFTWPSISADSISASKFTSPLATSYQYFASSAAADSTVWVQTGVAGDRDMVNKYVEDDGTVHTWRFDEGFGVFFTPDVIRSGAGLSVGGSSNIALSMYSNWGLLRSSGGIDHIWLDPDGNTGSDSVKVGSLGEGDIFISECDENIFFGITSADTLQMDAMYASILEISSATYTATASNYTIALIDTCAVTLPLLSIAYDSTAAATGYGLILFIAPENIGDCTVDANGTEEINGSTDPITLSPWDCLMLQATNRGWRIL